MLGNGAEGHNGLGPHGIQHSREVGVHETRIESELPNVFLYDVTVRLVDPAHLDVAFVSAPEYPADVAVRQTSYRDPQRLLNDVFHKRNLAFLRCLFSGSFPLPCRRWVQATYASKWQTNYFVF